MSKVELLTPLLEEGIRNTNFFNGRLLSAEDLRAEQTANRAQHGQLGRAYGYGIASGLEVKKATTPSTAGVPLVRVARGLAINSEGHVLELPADTDVALIPESEAVAASAGLFARCELAPSTDSAPTVGSGFYIFVISPASGFEGRASASGLSGISVVNGACGSRYTVEGVRFRLVRLNVNNIRGITGALVAQINQLIAAGSGGLMKLRSILAQLCFGTTGLVRFGQQPFLRSEGVSPFVSYGALDDLLSRGALTDCDVPLALIYLTPGGIQFLDMWSARRRIIAARNDDQWPPVSGDRRASEAEALFLQFQEQIAALQDAAIARPNFKAEDGFFYLPPAGFLPVGGNDFRWRTFLGPMAPPYEKQVDEALVRALIRDALTLDAVEVKSFANANTPGLAPPVPVEVYQVPGRNDFVVFVRSQRGRIRVFLTPKPTASQGVQIYASGPHGAWPAARDEEAGNFPITEVLPGKYKVKVIVEGFQKKRVSDVEVVGGRTTDLPISIDPLPKATIAIRVTVVGGGSISSFSHASAASGGAIFQSQYSTADDRIHLNNLPPGSYTLTIGADAYVTKTLPNVSVVLGQHLELDVALNPVIGITSAQPSTCVAVSKLTRPALLKGRLCLVLDRAPSVVQGFQSKNFIAEEAHTKTGKAASSPSQEASKSQIAFFSQPWLGMDEMEPISVTVKTWLKAWQKWLHQQNPSLGIGKATPTIFVERSFRPPRVIPDVPLTPQAYAVFGSFGVPLTILDEAVDAKRAIKIKKQSFRGLDDLTLSRLEEYGIGYVHQLAGRWAEDVADITGQSVESARYLVGDAIKAAMEANQSRAYYDDWPAIEAALGQLGFEPDDDIDPEIFLANTDAKQLGDRLQNEGYAVRVIEQARSVVPRESWSLDTLGLSKGQIAELNQQGIDSIGTFAGKAGTGGGLAVLAEALGIGVDANGAHTQVINELAQQAATALSDASKEFASQVTLTALPAVNNEVASQLAAAGVFAVEELVNTDAATISNATGLSATRAQSLINAGNAFLGR